MFSPLFLVFLHQNCLIFSQPLHIHPMCPSMKFYQITPSRNFSSFTLLLHHMKSRGQSGAPSLLTCASLARRHRDGGRKVGMGLCLGKIMEEEHKVGQEKPHIRLWCRSDICEKKEGESRRGQGNLGCDADLTLLASRKGNLGQRLPGRRIFHWAEMARLWQPRCAHCQEVAQEEPDICSKAVMAAEEAVT